MYDKEVYLAALYYKSITFLIENHLKNGNFEEEKQ